MKLPFSLLATALALTSLSSNALTQIELDKTAKTLNLNVLLVENKPADCPADSPWGFCYRIEIILKNNSNKAFNKDIDIYFSSVQRVIQSNSEEFTITHINGDLNRISTTDKFKGLKPGESTRLQFDAQNWIVSDTDFMPNYYLAAEGLEARVIANTVPVSLNGEEDISGFTAGIKNTPNQLKRNADDKTPIATAATRFAENSSTADLGKSSLTAKILPTPKKIIQQNGQLNIASGINLIAAKDSLPSEQQLVLNQRFNQMGIKTGSGVDLTVSVDKDSKEIAGSYKLKVTSSGISVEGADSSGAFYGVQSVISLITLGQTSIPNVTVEDSPRYDYRGMHMDVSRNFHSKDLVFKLLDQMAAYKLNKFHFHLADDEGWRLEIPGLPELTDVGSNRCHDLSETTCILPQLGSGPDTSTNGSGYYSVEDYKQILAYASARNIQVIPSMDMPGHSRAAIKSMDARYRKFMTQGDQKAAEMYLLADKYDETKYFSIQNYTDNTINPCLESSFVFIILVKHNWTPDFVNFHS